MIINKDVTVRDIEYGTDPFAACFRKENAAANFRPMLGIFNYHKGMKFVIELIYGVVVVQKKMISYI